MVLSCRSGRAGCKGPKAVCEAVNSDRKIEKGEGQRCAGPVHAAKVHAIRGSGAGLKQLDKTKRLCQRSV